MITYTIKYDIDVLSPEPDRPMWRVTLSRTVNQKGFATRREFSSSISRADAPTREVLADFISEHVRGSELSLLVTLACQLVSQKAIRQPTTTSAT
jgi:hypothetical protein